MFKGLLARAAAKASLVNIKFDAKRLIQALGVRNNATASKALWGMLENTVLALENNASQDDITRAMAEAAAAAPDSYNDIFASVLAIAVNSKNKNIDAVDRSEASLNQSWNQLMGDFPEVSTQTLSLSLKGAILATEGREGLKNVSSGKMADGSKPGLRDDDYAPKPAVPAHVPEKPEAKKVAPSVVNAGVSIAPLRELIEMHANTGFDILDNHEKIFAYAPDSKRAAVEIYGHHLWLGWRAMLDAVEKEIPASQWAELQTAFELELGTALALKGNRVLQEKVAPRYGIRFDDLYETDSLTFLKNVFAAYEDSIERHPQFPPFYSAAVRLLAEIFSGTMLLVQNGKLSLEMTEQTCGISNAIHDLVQQAISKFPDKNFVPSRL